MFSPIDAGSPGKPTNDGKPQSKARYIVAGIMLVVIIWTFVSCLSPKEKEKYDMNNKYEASSQCEVRIEKLLKAPSTAKFNSDATGYGTWTVTGTVDAENSFGAMIRANYQCTVVMNSENGTATTKIDSFDG